MATSRNSGVKPRTLEAFFELLRSGLWCENAATELFDRETDWQAIYKLSLQQTVAGVVFDGLSTLPAELQPNSDILKNWYGYVAKIEQSHALLNSVLGEIYTIYRNNGFTPVLLKGQGVATCYRNPISRQCGDIDLYIGEEDYPKATELVEKMGWTDEDTTESKKHLHFEYNGVTIENHRIVSELYHKKAEIPFHNAVRSWFPFDIRIEQIGGNKIALPPATFDAAFILLHASNHFISGGIGLRQLCDWVRVLHTYKDDIDQELLTTYIRDFNLERIWAVFGCIAVRYLGLPENEMPFYNSKYYALSQKAMIAIIQEGNFGKYRAKGLRPEGYLRGKFHSFKLSLKRLAGIYSISPSYATHYLFFYIKTAIGRIIQDKL